MEISIGTDNVHFKPVTVTKVREFIEFATTANWSQSVFRNNYRNLDNFLKAETIALDIDNSEETQMTIDEAVEIFKEYKHVIMPSRNHRKEKHGEVKDRFRVLLFLSEPITDVGTFYSTWESLRKQFPAIDPSCKDPSRYYYPSTECISYNTKGKTIDPVPAKIPSPSSAPIDESNLKTQTKGELSRQTLKFLVEGARPGQRHSALYKAARDYHQNNYQKEEFINDVRSMIARTGNWAHEDLSTKDLSTIDDAFRVQPKHDPRLSYTRALLFQPISDLLDSEENFEWLVDDLLSVGGTSIVAGDPKTGKSTLVRQLALAVARGDKFLTRSTQQGLVYYAALEEQAGLLKKQFKTLGATENDLIRIHVGPPLSHDMIPTLQDSLGENDVKMLVIDTFLLGLRIKDPNSYAEVYEALNPFRELARDTGTHILFIHHTNKKGMGSHAILGSNAIHGSVDCAMILKAIGRKRFLTAGGRGVSPFYDHELIFDKKTETYSLGESGGFDIDETGRSIF